MSFVRLKSKIFVILPFLILPVSGKESIEYALEKVGKAFDLACEHETIFGCKGAHDWWAKQVLEHEQLKGKEYAQEQHFEKWTRDNVIPKLSQEFRNCKELLEDPEAEPATDESKILEDEGKEYAFRAYAYCLVATLKNITGGAIQKDWSLLQYGMDKTIQAYDMVSEYEGTPKDMQAEAKDEALAESLYENDPKNQMLRFAGLSQMLLRTFSKPFVEKCLKYLLDPDVTPEYDESKIFEDEGKVYQFKGYAHCLVHTLIEVSGGKMKRDWNILYYGMEKASDAYHLVCSYEVSYNCAGKQKWIMNEMLMRMDMQNQTAKQMKTFGEWSQNIPLENLPPIYRETCGKYLTDRFATPPFDESKELKDERNNYPFQAYAYCLVHVLRERSNGTLAREWDTVFLGMEKAIFAFEVVCKYQKRLADNCKIDFRREYKVFMDWTSKKNITSYFYWRQFGMWIGREKLLMEVPEVYRTCKKYVNDPVAELPSYEDDVFDDSGKEYAYKALAHCLMQTLRSECGGAFPKEVEELKDVKADAPEDYD